MKIDQNGIKEILFFRSTKSDTVWILRCYEIFPNVRNRLVKKVMHLYIFEVASFWIKEYFV